jgi:hypothetical protein
VSRFFTKVFSEPRYYALLGGAVKVDLANNHDRERQYKRKIATWNLEKNIKDADVRIMLRKQLKRKLEDEKDSIFTVHGRSVPPQKLSRFVQRKEVTINDILANEIGKPNPVLICKSATYLTSIATPPYIACNTPKSDADSDSSGHRLEEGFVPSSKPVILSSSSNSSPIDDTAGHDISLMSSQAHTPGTETDTYIGEGSTSDVEKNKLSASSSPIILPGFQSIEMDMCGRNDGVGFHQDINLVANLVSRV